MGEPAERVVGRRARRAGTAVVVGAAFALTVVGLSSRPAAAQVGCTRVVGTATATPAQMAGWFATSRRQPRLDVSVLELATMFVEEGTREGVRGDIAFAQAIVETGYFGFSPSVPPETHNYSGIGATGGGVKGAAFPDARTGVRAQIQHLRAYADPTLRSSADLNAPLVDPRFRFLVPNPKVVPCWEQFGSGVWAADPTGYGPRVLSVHQRIAASPSAAAPAAASLAATPAPAPDAVAAVAPDPDPALATVVAGPGEPTLAGVVVDDLATGPPLAFQASSPNSIERAETAELPARPMSATSSGGGAAAALATLFTGAGLLAICTTLWWHGRRFART